MSWYCFQCQRPDCDALENASALQCWPKMTGAAEMNIPESFCRFAGCPKVNGVPKVEVVLLPKAMFVWLKEQSCCFLSFLYDSWDGAIARRVMSWTSLSFQLRFCPRARWKSHQELNDAGRRSCASTAKANPLLESSDAKIKILKIEQFQWFSLHI